MVRRFRKRVFERRAAVADAVRADVLRPVDMPQRHIVKAVKYGRIDVIRAAGAQLLGLAGARTGHELVRDQHVARGEINVHLRDRRAAGVRIALDRFIREEALYVRGLEKRQQPEVHGSVFVL